MLLDMLTADAAAKHGHTYSHAHDDDDDQDRAVHHGHAPPPRLPSPACSKHGAFSLAQMPLSLLGSVLRYQTPAPATPTALDDAHAASPMPPRSLSHPAAPLDSPAPSRPVSSGSSAVADDKARLTKKAPRPKTSYIIARPPPAVHPRSKLHIRPKVQLQLHQVLAAQRPKPVYEVIPFSLLAPPSTRRLARAFNTRERLGHHDLLIVKAAEYGHTDDEHKSDDERWGTREVVGVICPGKMDKGQIVTNTEICMDDGTSRWEVTHMPNGGYEFNSLDEHGLAMKARWVVKPPTSRRISSLSANSQLSPGLPPSKDDAKWNFSTITANSRRHPVIASMTRSRIDVNDSYTMPAATQPSTPDAHMPASPALTPASIDAASFLDAAPKAPIVTEEALRRFIVVSGIWVSSLHEGFELASSPSTHSFISSACGRPPMCRAASMSFLDSPRSASPASMDDNEKSIPKLLRNTSQKLNRHASFTDPPASPMSAKITPSSPAIKTRSRRANSTGTHNLRSMTGSLKKRYGIPSQVETLSETDEDKENKRSEEFLRLKQLALPTPIEVSPVETPAVEAPPRPPLLVISTSTIRASNDGSASPMLLPSPQLPEADRTRKTQSAFNPITTAGMWDSGVTDGPGLQRRPTSMFVMNERKRKEDKKRGRSEGRTKKQERDIVDRSTSKEDLKKGSKDKDSTGIRQKLKNSLKGMFARKEMA